ncbi:MAG: nucleotidyltransferase domain-containing protein [Candidatus Omnitrophica bacterium]|nr:nucleotidyltransferase domain-containing protein [Candidatus Omnitrophota bacterium]
MRLKETEVINIVGSIKSLDRNAKVYLFGSRVNNSKKGGDIDLLVISQKLGYGDSIKIRQRLYEKLGEQKIHLVIRKDTDDPFVKIALAEGLML